MSSLIFFIAPISGYLSAGILKFVVNSLKKKKLAFSEVGLGRFPSTHNTIVSTTYFVISFQKGFDSPESSIALALCLVVLIDSLDLRKKIETHARIISEISNKQHNLRKEIGHSPFEVFGGYFLGLVVALLLTSETFNEFLNYFS